MLTDPKLILAWLSIALWFVEPGWRSTHAQSLLPSDVQTTDVIADTLVDLTLVNGVVLSGPVRTEGGDPVALGTVTARSAAGLFAANIAANIQDGDSAYRMVLPPGTYDLNVSAAFQDAEESEIATLIYVTLDAVAGLGITADATQALMVPDLPDLATVTGFVMSQDAEPMATSGALQFVSTDGRTFTIAPFEDFYTARLPLDT